MKNYWDQFNLKGKTAVVTGGAGLLGKAFIEGLSCFGAKTILADIDEKTGEIVSQDLGREGCETEFIFMDIADEKSVDHCIQEVISRCGSIDIWINNAYPRTEDWGLAFEKIPYASWRENIDRHLNGYCLCCQRVAEEMKKKRQGSLINIASIYGIVGPDFSIYEGTEMTMPAAYSVIKGGIVNFTRYLASYYGPYGVRVNTLSPGGLWAHQPDTFVENYSKKTPLRRMGEVEDMIGAAIFLSSEASSYMTGHNLVVDGGWSAV